MKTATRLILAFAAVLFACTLASAADAPKVVGTWDAVASTPNGEMQSVLTIKEVGGALKADMELDGEKQVVTDEKLEGDVFKFKVTYQGGVYDIELKVAGDVAEGTWQGGGYSGTLKAKKRP